MGTLAAALTAWIFTREGTPFAGHDWIDRIGFPKHLYRTSLLAGDIPWWNPAVALGRPFAADCELALFYPPNLVFLLPAALALPASVWLHLVLVLVGSIRLGRTMGLGPAGHRLRRPGHRQRRARGQPAVPVGPGQRTGALAGRLGHPASRSPAGGAAAPG